MNGATEIHVTTHTFHAIPLLECLPAGPGPFPLVFFLPGFTGSRHDGLSLGCCLAQRGIALLALDPLFHGERAHDILHHAADPQQGGLYPAETGLDTGLLFFRIIRQSVDDVTMLMNALAVDRRFDLQRTGITGFSMGAYITYAAFAAQPRLRVAVPMMGLPTFTRRWLDLLDECTLSEPAWAQALAARKPQTRRQTEWITALDPADRLLEAPPRPLLIMNGDFDCDQPKQYTLSWYKLLRRNYAHGPDLLRWKIYPTAHQQTAQMERDAAAWFAQHLLHPPTHQPAASPGDIA